jgi:mannose-6-phosphate isomerase-like protein (cupin superfamily)
MTDSWWVKNARELEWSENGMGIYALAAADELAFTFNVLGQDQPMALYHHEPHQEGFLVLRGECDLLVEGETRRLHEWDYVHCPPGVAHVIVGAGEEPALVVAVGSRVGGGKATYPNDPDPRAAYERFGEPRQVDPPL